ncbi:hypothetical protein PC119_g26595 [Phytophthora cactorum]|nr:hypothetical protein PC119_g26595 [Phytophthora cactorum]
MKSNTRHRDHPVTESGVDRVRRTLNKETGAVFQQRLEERETAHDWRFVAALPARVCRMSYDLDHQCCYVHFVDGCPRCRGYHLPRPIATGLQRFTEDVPITEAE